MTIRALRRCTLTERSLTNCSVVILFQTAAAAPDAASDGWCLARVTPTREGSGAATIVRITRHQRG